MIFQNFGAKDFLKGRLLSRRAQPFIPIQEFGFLAFETEKIGGNSWKVSKTMAPRSVESEALEPER